MSNTTNPVYTVSCICGANEGQPCISRSGKWAAVHKARQAKYDALQQRSTGTESHRFENTTDCFCGSPAQVATSGHLDDCPAATLEARVNTTEAEADAEKLLDDATRTFLEAIVNAGRYGLQLSKYDEADTIKRDAFEAGLIKLSRTMRATLTTSGLEYLSKPEPEIESKPKRTSRGGKKPAVASRLSAHADCDHDTTKAARAKCRRDRAKAAK